MKPYPKTHVDNTCRVESHVDNGSFEFNPNQVVKIIDHRTIYIVVDDGHYDSETANRDECHTSDRPLSEEVNETMYCQ